MVAPQRLHQEIKGIQVVAHLVHQVLEVLVLQVVIVLLLLLVARLARLALLALLVLVRRLLVLVLPLVVGNNSNENFIFHLPKT